MSKVTKKSRDYCGLPRDELKVLNSLSPEEIEEFGGIFGGMRKQTQAERLTVASEEIVGQGKDNNAFIVIGNDRYGPPHTGYGGKAHTQCDSIDLVAGLGGFCPVLYEDLIDWDSSGPTPDAFDEETGLPRMKVETSPNFFLDAARIYIAQKTDVDKNFGIAEFNKRSNEELCEGGNCAKSAVAIKADNVRLIARETLRLVTGTDKANSQGGKIDGEKAGIELIANNDHTTLQPLVLGDNLAEGLRRVLYHVEAMAHTFHAYVKFQQKFNQALQSHTHNSPFFGIPTTESIMVLWSGFQLDLEVASRTEVDMLKHGSNVAGVKSKYFYESGTKWIGSSNNKTN